VDPVERQHVHLGVKEAPYALPANRYTAEIEGRDQLFEPGEELPRGFVSNFGSNPRDCINNFLAPFPF
jgi:hypothetical protein